MFNFLDVEQNTDEWLSLRAGKLTSSKIGIVMANFGKAFGEPAKKYAINIAIEQITKTPILSGFSNDHMTRGHEQEPLARMLYEEETFCEVSNGGFFESDFVGCSPDGLVYEKGVIEIKSVIPSVHYANISRGNVDPAYKWQCLSNLKFTGRDWIDFISYCDEFPVGKRLFIHRVYKEKCSNYFDMIEERVEDFKGLVKKTREKIMGSNYLT